MDVGTCQGRYQAHPFVANGFVVYADILPPILLVVKLQSLALSCGNEFVRGVTWEASQLAPAIFLEETDIFMLELHGLLHVVLQALHRIFPNLQQVIESY
jgi:hypothetical protein